MRIKFKNRNHRRTLGFLVCATFVVLCATFFALTNVSSGANRDFALAGDFPRGALVYAQTRDLPALLKVWDESEFKKRYLDSQHFADFQKRHLALKLAARLQEFDDALGFDLDWATIARGTETNVAVGVYDIGKIELVFIAPLSPEKSAATAFFQNRKQFETVEFDDNTTYYSREVEADRGRQKQKILFAFVKNRFVLATSESLMRRALANVNRTAKNDCLADEPEFRALTEKTRFHNAVVWAHQAKLNDDWYFKHYWIGGDTREFKNFRAGVFDFEIAAGKIVERREFLLAAEGKSQNNLVSGSDAAALRRFVPGAAAYFKIESLGGETDAASLIEKTIFDSLPAAPEAATTRWTNYDDHDFDREESDSFDYYGQNDEIDDSSDDSGEIDKYDLRRERETILKNELANVLNCARPKAAAFIAAPQTLEKPLFVEFRRAAVLSFGDERRLSQNDFEKQISALVQNRLAVGGADLNLTWNARRANNFEWRELELPALNARICAARDGDKLIVASSREMIEQILSNRNAERERKESAEFDELIEINLAERETAFNQVFARLVQTESQTASAAADSGDNLQSRLSGDFFTGNVGSLLDALRDAKRISIIRKQTGNRLLEQIELQSETRTQ